MADDDLPRGLRNNNPGNLVDNAYTRAMPGYVGSDGRFAKFATPHDGIAAMHQNLQSYAGKGIDTPSAIANRWAPAGDGDNNPDQYAGSIAKQLGIGPNDKIDMSDPDTRERLAHAMAVNENGPKATDYFGGKVANYLTPSSGKFSLGGPTAAAPSTTPKAPSVPSDAGAASNLLAGILKGSASNKVPEYKPNDPNGATPQTKLEGMVRAAAGQGTYTPPIVAKLNGLTGALGSLFGGSNQAGQGAPDQAGSAASAAPAPPAPDAAPPQPPGSSASLASADPGGTSSGDVPLPPPRPADLGTPVADAGSGGLDLSGALSSLFG